MGVERINRVVDILHRHLAKKQQITGASSCHFFEKYLRHVADIEPVLTLCTHHEGKLDAV